MTRTTTTPLAVAADYADALMTARRAKNALVLLLMLLIIAQLAVFLLAKFGQLKLSEEGTPTVKLDTQPATAPTSQPTTSLVVSNMGQVVRYATPVMNFLGIALSIVLVIVLLLLVAIMLVGRLIGVSHVTGAFIWGVLLIVLLFPWQTFLIPDVHYPVTGSGYSASDVVVGNVPEQPNFKWPGAFYTWAELKRDYNFSNDPLFPQAVWMWGRYVGLPVLSLLILLFLVQGKSSRGLKFALGEAEVHVEVTRSGDTVMQ
jgi:hypothetical protein